MSSQNFFNTPTLSSETLVKETQHEDISFLDETVVDEDLVLNLTQTKSGLNETCTFFQKINTESKIFLLL